MKTLPNFLLASVIGDICGSPYEFKPEKDISKITLMSPRATYTDDSVCTMAIAAALLENLPLAKTLQTICQSEKRGYGGRFRRWIWEIDPKPYGSWGNGSAMRVSGVVELAKTEEECIGLATKTAEITHNHPEGIKGAVAAALTSWKLLRGATKDDIRRDILGVYYPGSLNETVESLRPGYKFQVSCQKSVPESIICFLDSESFSDCILKAISLGGDSDTMAAIAGPMAYAYYQVIPGDLLGGALSKIPDWMIGINNLYDRRVNE